MRNLNANSNEMSNGLKIQTNLRGIEHFTFGNFQLQRPTSSSLREESRDGWPRTGPPRLAIALILDDRREEGLRAVPASAERETVILT